MQLWFDQTEKIFCTNYPEMDVYTKYYKIAWYYLRNTCNYLNQIPYFPGWVLKLSVNTAFSSSFIFFFHKWKIIFFSWIPQPKVTFIWLNEELFDCTNKRLEMLMQIKDFLEMTLIFFMTIFIMSQLNDDWSSPNISVNFKESLGYKKNHPYVQLYLWYRINYTNY